MYEQCKITVVDCPPGAGKTSYAIQYSCKNNSENN